jgi:molybdopterin/thiamine biosynthesis adenylyltransferase
MGNFQAKVKRIDALGQQERVTKHGTKFTVSKPGNSWFSKGSEVDFHITRDAIEKLIDLAAAQNPEIGGLGFGLHDKLGVDTVELDKKGSQRASNVVYANDGVWCNDRQQHYLHSVPMRTMNMAWHTHPGTMGSPSGKVGRALGDMGMFEEFFKLNEWMQVLYCPILTHGYAGNGDLSINLNPWVCVRDANEPCGFKIGLGKVIVHKNSSTLPAAMFNPVWEASVEINKQTISRKPLIESTPSVSTGQDIEMYISRIEGVVSSRFRGKTILCIGTGGGSYFVEKLVRYMPKKVILIDPDVVSISNLSRTNFTFSDAKNERKKTDALRERLHQINPFVEVDSYSSTMADMPEAQARGIAFEADLIVEGTDNFASKKLTNELARGLRKPALYIGVHAGAKSGRLIWSYPGISPCYECAAHDRYMAAAANSAVDLDAQRGSVVDIQLIDMTSLRVALAMLEAGQDSVMGRFFEQLKVHGSDIMIRTSLESEWGQGMFSALLSDLPKSPKPFAAELQQFFLGIDVTAFPATNRPECSCVRSKKVMNAYQNDWRASVDKPPFDIYM